MPDHGGDMKKLIAIIALLFSFAVQGQNMELHGVLTRVGDDCRIGNTQIIKKDAFKVAFEHAVGKRVKLTATVIFDRDPQIDKRAKMTVTSVTQVELK